MGGKARGVNDVTWHGTRGAMTGVCGVGTVDMGGWELGTGMGSKRRTSLDQISWRTPGQGKSSPNVNKSGLQVVVLSHYL